MTRRALLASAVLQAQPPDWRALLERSITHDDKNLQLLRGYVFEIYDVVRTSRHLRESQSYEVNLVGPAMYFRKLQSNDLPLSPEETSLEQKRLRIHLTQPATTDANAPWRKERELLKTWLSVHHFEFRGRRAIDGRPVLMIESRPPSSGIPEALAFLEKAECRIALDEETSHWVETICEIRKRTVFSQNQLMLGRLSLPYSPGLAHQGDLEKGTRLHFRLRRTEDGVWVPDFYRTQISGFLSEMKFSNFRKFTAESHLLTEPQ